MGKIVLDYPLLAVVEVKKNDFKAGWAQCGSEMYAIQQLNKEPNQRVFGIVSNGETWEFAQLMQNTFTFLPKDMIFKNLTFFTVLWKLFISFRWVEFLDLVYVIFVVGIFTPPSWESN